MSFIYFCVNLINWTILESVNSVSFLMFVGIICAPILLVWTSIRGDLEATMNFPYLLFPGFQVLHFHKKKFLKFTLDHYVGKMPLFYWSIPPPSTSAHGRHTIYWVVLWMVYFFLCMRIRLIMYVFFAHLFRMLFSQLLVLSLAIISQTYPLMPVCLFFS